MAIHKKRSNISEEVRNDHGEREVERRAGLKETIKDALGLPPGDGTPHGKGRKATESDTPTGTLTSADREPNRPAAREHE
jgi:hypothetical protein